MWSALLAQANANHATASTLLHLVQQRGVEAPVCLLEPDHLQSWFAASQDAHDLSQDARGVLHFAEAECFDKQVGDTAAAEAQPKKPIGFAAAATVVAPPLAPSNRREQLERKTVDENHMGAILMTPPPRSRAVVHETPSKVALPSACADVAQRGPHTGGALSVESVAVFPVTDATDEAQGGPLLA